MYSTSVKQKPGETRLISALQFKWGMKRQELSFMVVLTRDKDGEEEDISPIIQDVLKSFEDVMLDQLPRKLPPRREMDHQIKLLLGVKPSAKGPYRMALLELAELQK